MCCVLCSAKYVKYSVNVCYAVVLRFGIAEGDCQMKPIGLVHLKWECQTDCAAVRGSIMLLNTVKGLFLSEN